MIRIVAAALLLASTGIPGHADPEADCMQSIDANKAIQGCSILIRQGIVTGSVASRQMMAIYHEYRGSAYEEIGDLDSAIADFDKAIALWPNYNPPYFGRSGVYERKGDFERAIADISAAIEIEPSRAALTDRAMLYERTGQLERAISDLDEAIKLDSSLWPSLNYMQRGRLHQKIGNKERAFSDYGKAIELEPNSAVPYAVRGRAYWEEGEYDRAIADLNRAIELAPDNARYYRGRGLVYERSGDKERAIADYRKALELKPGEQEAAAGLKRLGAAAQPNPIDSTSQAWIAVQDSDSTDALEAFLKENPEGVYAELANARLKKLTEKTKVATGDYPERSKAELPLKPGDEFEDCDACPKMVVVPAGSFLMGSPASERARSETESPQRKVTIAKPFAVGKFEVTKAQFEVFVRETGHDADEKCWTYEGGKSRISASRSWRNLGFAQGGDHPVACVNWNEAKAYVAWLSRKTGKSYRLLTEAEWEYAARAGTTTPFHTGRTIDTDQANFDGTYTYHGRLTGQYRGKTVPVGSFSSNAYGLHDMHGNVKEFVEDCYTNSYTGVPSDGSAQTTENCHSRGNRGGSWSSGPRNVRSAERGWTALDYRSSVLGFRIARTLN